MQHESVDSLMVSATLVVVLAAALHGYSYWVEGQNLWFIYALHYPFYALLVTGIRFCKAWLMLCAVVVSVVAFYVQGLGLLLPGFLYGDVEVYSPPMWKVATATVNLLLQPAVAIATIARLIRHI